MASVEGSALATHSRAFARAFVLAALSLFLTASSALAFTAADPGFASSDFAAVPGVTALAFDAGGALYTNTDGGLAYVGTHLYAVSRAAQEIRELDAAGAVIRTVTTSADIACPDGLAGWTNDLYVTSCGGVYRVRSINTAPVVEYFSNPGSSPIATHAITISADGQIFATAGSNIWKLGSVTSVAPSFGAVFIGVPNAIGIATLPAFGTTTFRFLFTTTSDGTVRVYDHTGTIAPHAILTNGSGGDASSIGPDGCLYVPQTAGVVRVANANGTCDLIAALGATPSVSLSGGVTNAHIGGSPVTFTAALANVPTGTLVTFTVTGANPQVATAPMDPITHRATFSYTGTVAGTDTITAQATVGGATVVSSPLTQLWKPPFDATAPLISFAVTGGGANVLCPGAVGSDDPLAAYCGWYATPPAVHWTYADPESGVGAATGCDDFALAGDSPLTGTPVTCTVTNGDGLSSHKTVILQALVTPPLITATATSSGAPYVAGTPTRSPVIVTFSCTHHAGPAAIASCSAPVTIARGDGTAQSASGTATDLAGKTAEASFGPILVDTTGPRVTVTATQGASPYVFGSWTRDGVLLTFSCTDASGVGACPAAQLVTSRTGGVSVAATDALGNTSSFTTGPINIDTTPPATVATVTGASAGADTYALSATVALAATDDGAGVARLVYRVDGGAPVTVPGASASFTVTAEGPHTVTFFAGDAVNNFESAQSIGFTIVHREHTTLALTSPAFVPSGSLVSALLLSESGTALAGETVTFAAGGVTRSATTDASGVARADLGLAPGTYTLGAAYAGTDPYFPSAARSQPITVFALARFVVYAPNATLGATVQFYGGDWSKQIFDKDARKAFEDFKGYSDGAQGGMWTARSGDATKPPKSVPEYIGVILTTSASKTKDAISGDVTGVAIVRVSGGDDPKKPRPYDGKLGDRGFGTVVGRP